MSPAPIHGAAPPGRLTVATYNIHAGVGRDRHTNLPRLTAVIRELDADIIALQEVLGQEVLDMLAEATGYHALAGPTLLKDGRHYGNAVLTALPVDNVERIDLSVFRREPRGAIDVRLAAGAGGLRLLVTHLGLAPGERRHQTLRLLEQLEQGPPAGITLLVGDLNEWLLWGRPRRWLTRWFARTPAPATFPALLPLLALDRIWVRPRPRLVSVTAHRSPLARIASDHLPLKAVVEV
ncbi:MAG: endonuclease/exonuclease/phosphatase family protein [Gammaproteobacteria bacterium]|nr:endonuclease/exonuclease/phosphatase family protein [Gammaproteobacteria bacterium]